MKYWIILPPEAVGSSHICLMEDLHQELIFKYIEDEYLSELISRLQDLSAAQIYSQFRSACLQLVPRKQPPVKNKSSSAAGAKQEGGRGGRTS